MRHDQSRGEQGSAPPGPTASPPMGSATTHPAGTPCSPRLLIEVLLTAVFLYVILGVTDTRAPKGFAAIAIGLAR